MSDTASRTTMTRRRLLATAAATGGGLALAACGGAAVPAAPSQNAAVATATLPPATSAPATAAATATAAPVATVNVVAKEYEFLVDRLVVPAGTVRFTFKNAGNMTHDFWVAPPQDLSAYLAKKRAGIKVKGKDYLTGATELFDLDAGKSGQVDHQLKPGYYELTCFVMSKQPDGSAFVHFDRGQSLWLTVTGAGFPPPAATTDNTIAVQMKGEEAGPWLFVPDKLVVPAGDVTFKVTNGMKQAHDFVVHPLGDIQMLVDTKLKQGMTHGFDYGKIKGTELFEDLAAGTTGTKTLKLAPGTYVAACYMVSKGSDGTPFLHRDRGQRFVFMVK